MGILTRLERGPQASISGDLWRRILSGGGATSTAGVRISDEAAAAVSSVFACVRVASEDIAKLPLILYQRTKGGGKRRAFDHPLYALLHDRPNDWMTSFEFRQLMQVHAELWGNAFAFINRVRGEVRELIPIHPDQVSVRQTGGWEMEYEIRGDTKKTRGPSEILHLRGLSTNGVEGVALRRIARDAIGLAIATERHGARLFANGARASGVLKHQGTLSDPAAERLKQSTQDALSGEKAHSILLLEEGMDWAQMTMSSDDAQFLETRKFQVTEIARYFRMQAHKINDLERATFSNIEHQSLEYVTDSLMPRQVRWEQRLNAQVLGPQERGAFFFEFLNDALLRGDTKTRYEAYSRAINDGWMSPNEARVKENLNPKPGLDEYRRPMNTEPVGTPAPPAEETNDG